MADAKRAQGALEAFPQHSAEFEPCSCRHLDWFDLHAWLKYREKSIFFSWGAIRAGVSHALVRIEI